jgi:hypothetical protein
MVRHVTLGLSEVALNALPLIVLQPLHCIALPSATEPQPKPMYLSSSVIVGRPCARLRGPTLSRRKRFVRRAIQTTTKS